MAISVSFNASTITPLIARMKRAGKKTKSEMRKALRQETAPMRKEMKSAFASFAKTGAMMRSVGVISRKSGIMVGVRYKFRDTKTGKIPNKYAAQANARNGDPFGGVWNKHKEKIPMAITRRLMDNLLKKGY